MAKQHSTLTQARVKELLDYDPETGLFRWRVKRQPGIKPGDMAGNKHHEGYIHICVEGKLHGAHRLAWLWVYGTFPKDKLDHKNNIKDDNRLCNLRECNNAQNIRNGTLRVNNTSGYRGVSYHKAKKLWIARVRINGKEIEVGRCICPIEAALAYNEAAKEHYGEFANLNLLE